jgi:hypothetical protein
MAGHLGYLIAGGVICGEGVPLLILGVMYRFIFAGIPMLYFLWNVFIIIGAISTVIGSILLISGMYKYSHRYDAV